MESKPFFIIGIIGYLILIFHIVVTNSPFHAIISSPLYVTLLTVGLYLGAFTFFGYYQKYNKNITLITFIASLALSWVLLAAFLLDPLTPMEVSGILHFFGFLFVGIVFALWGLTMMLLKEDTNQVMTLISGIMFVLAAGPFMYYYGGMENYLLVACLIIVATLLSSEIYQK